MQDIHSIGGGGRFFAGTGGGAGAAGGGGGGDRRLRPQHHFHHHNNHGQQAQPPALKCPRCDSANTKFCYYNNYNLSQPRHFCKSCRRYWTKGGVLRNVPVGGGCRKTKRSKQKGNSSAAAATAAVTAATNTTTERKSSNSNSSSESSSLTATTNAVASANTTEAVSAPPSNTSDQSKFPPPPTTTMTTAILEGSSSSDCGIFSEIGSFTNLIATNSSSAAVVGGSGGGGGASTMPFEFGTISDVSIGPFRLNNWNQQSHNPDHDQELKVQGGSLLIDQTAQVDLSVLQQDRSNGGGFGSLGDWQQCGDQGLFDLTNTVDQAYWSQNQWNVQDNPSLYLP